MKIFFDRNTQKISSSSVNMHRKKIFHFMVNGLAVCNLVFQISYVFIHSFDFVQHLNDFVFIGLCYKYTCFHCEWVHFLYIIDCRFNHFEDHHFVECSPSSILFVFTVGYFQKYTS